MCVALAISPDNKFSHLLYYLTTFKVYELHSFAFDTLYLGNYVGLPTIWRKLKLPSLRRSSCSVIRPHMHRQMSQKHTTFSVSKILLQHSLIKCFSPWNGLSSGETIQKCVKRRQALVREKGHVP